MRIASIDRVDCLAAPEQLPLEVRQSSKFLRSGLLIGLSLAAIGALLTPVVLIAADTVQHPDAILQMAGRPVSTLLLTAGLAIGLALMMFPLRSGLSGFGRRRNLVVGAELVEIEDKGLTGTRRWRVPIDDYCGVTHHIRATLSGARHEIILVHSDRAGDLLLALDDRAPQQGAEHYARLLGLPVLPAKTYYVRRRVLPESEAAQVGVQSAAA